MSTASIHPELRGIARVLPRGGLGPRVLRAIRRVERLAARRPPPEGVTVERVGSVSVRVHRPSGAGDGPLPALLWIHGGGYVLGMAAQDDRLCREYAHSLGALVVAVDYRSAPEHPFPAALQDCHDALGVARRAGRRRPGAHRDRRSECGGWARRRARPPGTRARRGPPRVPAPGLPDAGRPHRPANARRRARRAALDEPIQPVRVAVLPRCRTRGPRRARRRGPGPRRGPVRAAAGLDRRGHARPVPRRGPRVRGAAARRGCPVRGERRRGRVPRLRGDRPEGGDQPTVPRWSRSSPSRPPSSPSESSSRSGPQAVIGWRGSTTGSWPGPFRCGPPRPVPGPRRRTASTVRRPSSGPRRGRWRASGPARCCR